ncbi:hypothetical protein [Caldimonas brevitalea]|uniref:PEGA domain-containing protein n=1 Tax=Caldimonas brevitalea TaxID=413882 RepID=A0A0G3BE44_9BURK|nr:hypothetical protein [Caldimonas brevitalea]AKJ27572.1 hypothetical protein AAW51_0881 [Caldimonas brevitalea]
MKHAVIIAAALVLSGCASIFSGSTQSVTISSEPAGANIVVLNRAGIQVHSGTTPATVTLNRGAGYFKSESYVVRVQKEGYAPKEVTLTGTVNGWYFGNILVGGLIGMLAIDPVTGAMYSLPSSVNATLEPSSAKTSAAPASMTIVAVEDVAPEVMKKARLIATF